MQRRNGQPIVVNPSNGDKATMQRIHEYDIIDQVRAARAWSNTSAGHDADSQLYAFLSIFHPEMSHAQKRDVLNNTERAEQRREARYRSKTY